MRLLLLVVSVVAHLTMACGGEGASSAPEEDDTGVSRPVPGDDDDDDDAASDAVIDSDTTPEQDADAAVPVDAVNDSVAPDSAEDVALDGSSESPDSGDVDVDDSMDGSTDPEVEPTDVMVPEDSGDADSTTDATDTGADSDTAGVDADTGDVDATSPPDVTAFTPLDPNLDIPPGGNPPCTTPGSLAQCREFSGICRHYSAEESRCESCDGCGNLNARCDQSADCDILFTCFQGRCTAACSFETPQTCGIPTDCTDVGHPTHGVCRPR
jgi:hypothetical protein